MAAVPDHCHTFQNVTDSEGKVIALRCYCGEEYTL